LAYYFHHHLSKILPNAILLDAAQGVLFDRIINISPKDALVVINFYPYTKMTLQVAQYFREKGCMVITITDGILSPSAQISDFFIQVKTNSQSFVTSHTAAVCVINCLIAGIAMTNSKRSIKALKKIESKLPHWDTWAVKRG
jgi:DNA-binding MurR/RpiR family transcriptional regulator